MKPGRELDALVAEHVMGLKVDWEFEAPRSSTLADKYDEMGWLPYYSTDIAAAWEVVEKINLFANGDFLTRTYYGWTVENYNGYTETFRDVAEGTTAPHTICLAALRAVGYELT